MTISAIITWIAANGLATLGAAQGVLIALIAFFALVPGAEPEATLQKVVDFISKFSRK